MIACFNYIEVIPLKMLKNRGIATHCMQGKSGVINYHNYFYVYTEDLPFLACRIFLISNMINIFIPLLFFWFL